MPRTKKPRPRDSSLLPGATLGPDSVRYLEVMVEELQCTMDSSVAAAQAIANQICHQVDMWYDNIIRVVPEEILNLPYEEAMEKGFVIPTPDTAALTTVLSATSSATKTSADTKPSASKQPRLKKLAVSAKAKRASSQHGPMMGGKKKASEEPASLKPKKKLRKSSMCTPSMMRLRPTASKLPIVTPKFDIRKRPTTARKARKGETLLSLSGSPVETKPAEAVVHVHIDKGKVVKMSADTSKNSSVQKLCKDIQKLCYK